MPLPCQQQINRLAIDVSPNDDIAATSPSPTAAAAAPRQPCSSCHLHDSLCRDQRTTAAAGTRYSNQHSGCNLSKIFFFLLLMASLWENCHGTAATEAAARLTTVPKSNLLIPNSNGYSNKNIVDYSNYQDMRAHQSLDYSAVSHSSRNHSIATIPINRGTKPKLNSDPWLTETHLEHGAIMTSQKYNQLLKGRVSSLSNGSYYPPAGETAVSVAPRFVRSAGGRHKKECQALDSNLLAEEKLVLSPIVIQGRLVSRSNAYNSLYFVSFRVLKVMKGKVPKKLRKHIRLMFHMDNSGRDGRR